MPVTIKQHLLKVKDGSTYVGIDALAETTTAEHVTAINDAGAAQIAAVAAQGEASRASIPQEYTALSDSVNDLKSAVGAGLLTKSPYLTQGYIDGTGKYNNMASGSDKSSLIPVNGGESFSIQASSLYTYYAAIKSFNSPATGDTPDYSSVTGWTSFLRIDANASTSGTLPSDAKFLLVYLGKTTADLSRAPLSVVINGYDYAKTIAENILDKSPTVSPSFTGNPTAPTQTANDNSTKIATTAYSDSADNAVKELIKTNYFTFESDYATSLTNVGKDPDAEDRINIDTLITPGNYKVTTSAAAASLDGDVPTSDVGYKLVVIETTQSDRTYQIAYPNSNTRIRYRKYNGSTWSSWEVLLNQADIESRIATAKAEAIVANPARIRIMQYNCGMWAMGGNENMTSANFQTKMDNYRRLFCKYHPDVIGIQEWVDELTISGLTGTQSINAELFTPMYPYNMDYIDDGSSKGRTVKSRFEPISVSTGAINKADFGYTGNCLYSKMILNYFGRRVAVLSTAIIPTSSYEANISIRAALLPLLLNLIKDEDYAFLVCDVNNGGNYKDSGSITAQDEGNSLNAIAETNGFKAAMGPYYPWTPSYKNYSDPTYQVPIDNIFYKNNGKIQLSDYQVLMDEYNNLFSDHAPCIGDFILL